MKAKELENKVRDMSEKESVKETKEKEELKTPKDTSRPVSSTPVSGTPWYFHYRLSYFLSYFVVFSIRPTYTCIKLVERMNQMIKS